MLSSKTIIHADDDDDDDDDIPGVSFEIFVIYVSAERDCKINLFN